MNISKFSIAEMFSNSKGKSSASLVCGTLSVFTGCTMGIIGAIEKQGDSMINGLGFVASGSILLGVRRFTSDKSVDPNADPVKITTTETQKTETKIE